MNDDDTARPAPTYRCERCGETFKSKAKAGEKQFCPKCGLSTTLIKASGTDTVTR